MTALAALLAAVGFGLSSVPAPASGPYMPAQRVIVAVGPPPVPCLAPAGYRCRVTP